MRIAPFVLLALAGCDLYFGRAKGPPDAVVQTSPPWKPPPTNDVDLLFVLDDVASTADKQVALDASLPTLVAALDALPNGRPNLHVGVVSTSVSIGSSNFGASCANGDDGLLQNSARVPGCAAPTGRFIIDVASPNGRFMNYPPTQTLAQEIACISALGTGGCGFAAPLEAMKRALDGSRSENAGFVRDGAALVIVLFVDRDDCSASPALFGLTVGSPAVNDSDVRCAIYGETCDQPISATGPGTYTDCHPTTGGYLHDVSSYVDFLTTLKAPRRIVVLAIAGDPSSTLETGPISSPFSQQLALLPSCTATVNGSQNIARPANRLDDLDRRLSASGAATSFETICVSDYSAYMAQLADEIAAAMR